MQHTETNNFPATITVLFIVLFLIQSCSNKSTQEYTPVTKSLELPENAVENLSAAIRIPTISYDNEISMVPDTLKFKEFHEFLKNRYPLVHSNMTVETVNGLSLVYKWTGDTNSDKKPVLLLAHMDVVPVDDHASWTHSPFSGTIENGYVWGRGTLDDKGSIIGIMEASEMLLKEGFTPQRSIYFAFGHDEEVGGRNGALEIARQFQDRGIRFEYSLDEGGIVTDGVVPGMEPPVALIGIAEKGFLSLELTARTAGGHSAMPPIDNSIVIISNAISRLNEEPFPARISEAVDIFLNHIGPEQSFFNRMAIGNKWLFRRIIIRSYSASASGNATVRTTMAPTILQAGVKNNVIPVEARAIVNFRLLQGTTRNDVINHVKNVIDDDRIQIQQYANYTPPSPVSSHESGGYRNIRDLARDHFDSVAVAPFLVIAGTDSRHFTEVTGDSYRFLPVLFKSRDIDRIHGTDERISIDNFRAMTSFYFHFLGNH